MTPQTVKITHDHHIGQTGVWLHSTSRGTPMVRTSDTACVMIAEAHLEILGEAVFAPIGKSFNPRAEHRAAQRELEHAK